ncbi:hypothetical protein M501DRAFT_990218 [Patellaria atrata CBS 101060]|uniref:Uncharacterized protein n=1 Tax=Patellaria atrata CBS 101060 TaxID=1346257 RepID=A0A9P4VS73_9PEZI|nr:hypothetical protein M501DRAFT_990218 [Patellaria atrata CBS 101060]
MFRRNEPENLAVRYRKFNVSALINVAVNFIGDGAKSFFYKTTSEVATRNFLRIVLNLPVQHIYAYSADPLNPVGAEKIWKAKSFGFMIWMSKPYHPATAGSVAHIAPVPRHPLYNIFVDPGTKKLTRIIDWQLASDRAPLIVKQTHARRG